MRRLPRYLLDAHCLTMRRLPRYPLDAHCLMMRRLPHYPLDAHCLAMRRLPRYPLDSHCLTMKRLPRYPLDTPCLAVRRHPCYPLDARCLAMRRLTRCPLDARCLTMRRLPRYTLYYPSVSVRKLSMRRLPVLLWTLVLYSAVSFLETSTLFQTTLSVSFLKGMRRFWWSVPLTQRHWHSRSCDVIGFAGCLTARCCCCPLQYNKFCHIFSLKNENNLKKIWAVSCHMYWCMV